MPLLIGRRSELCQTIVQLVRQLYDVTDRRHRSRGPCVVCRVMPEMICIALRDAFRPTHLLFRSEGNFLNEFGRLTNDARNRFERFAGLIGEARADFHFARALFHHDHRFVRLGLNRLDERGDIFRRAAGVFGELADFVGDHRETAAPSPARAASIAAFSASRLVCSVMSLITLMISEISSERSPRDLIFFAVACTRRESVACLRAYRERRGCLVQRRPKRGEPLRRWLPRCWKPVSSKP